MKPRAHTASLSASVGAPWDIVRTRSRVTSGYVVDLYTKSGSVDQYQSLLILVSDLQVVFSILAAGPDARQTVNMATETAVQTFLPALDEANRSQACHRFCGTYAPAGATANASLALETDDEGSGLLVRRWTSDGVDVLRAAQEYSDATTGGRIRSIRLYPTNLYSPGSSDSAELGGSVANFRAVFEKLPTGYNASTPRILDPNANQWGAVDELMYGGVGVDDWVFYLDSQGSAIAVEPRVLREA